MSKQKEMLDSHSDVIAYYLSVGLQLYLKNLSQNLLPVNNKKSDLLAEDYFSIFNTIFIEGFLILGNLKTNYKVKINLMSAEDAFK